MLDGYARLIRTGRTRLGRVPGRPNGLLFVDIEPGADIMSLREIPAEYLAGARHIVFRSSERYGVVHRILEGRGAQAAVHWLHNMPGQATVCDAETPTSAEPSSELVERCRAAEVLSLLDWGQAIWEPTTFHFVLPSGAHAPRFIRLANALREPRDAEVLADWLLPFVFDDTAVLVDTGTLTPVILALRLRLASHGREIDGFAALDQYPHTMIDVVGAIDSALGSEKRRLLCLISVTSSGSLRDLLAASGRLGASLTRMDIVSVVELLGSNASGTKELGVHRFVSLPDKAGTPASWQSDSCEACLDPARSTIVPIDIRTFDAVFPTLVRREMPAVASPRSNRLLWEQCDFAGAILFEAEPDFHVRPFRPASERMAVKVDLSAVLAAVPAELGRRAAARVIDAIDPIGARGDPRHPANFDWSGFDLALIPECDVNRTGFEEFWSAASGGFGARPPHVSVSPSLDWSPETEAAVRGASKILIATIGTVTGTTLQQLLVRVQTLRRDAAYELFGVAFHARPSRLRAWDTLRNSFAFRLLAPWFSLLPDWSPLRDEAATLAGVNTDALSPHAVEFLEDRMLICQGSPPNNSSTGLLWGTNSATTLSSHSIFGNRLGARATFLSVGSAIHTRREESRQAPERIVFEMPAIARSYYDPLIFCSMLRWMRADEMWWGDSPASARQVVQSVMDRSDPKDGVAVAAELLLAAAQRKLPRAADAEARALCGERLASHPAWEVGRLLLLQVDRLSQ